MIGAIEAGGTKFVCAVADDSMNIVDRCTIPTTKPEETLPKCVEFFSAYAIERLGIGAFGPLDVIDNSNTYGTILNTPKKGWKNIDLISPFKDAFQIPVKVDTDVNAAGLGEYYDGHGKGKSSVLYITIGTGVGAGYILDGKPLKGFSHPEMGHILIRQRKEDTFEGNCPFHNTCLEGLVSGPAIKKRCGVEGKDLGKDHEVWGLVTDYIAQALTNYILILVPEVIIIGGGVSQQEHLFPIIRKKVKTYLNGYFDHPIFQTDLEDYIVYPKHGQNAGLLGSLFLAKEAKN